MAKSAGFEENLKRLEKIVEEMESGDLTLEESLARYEEAVKSLKKCYTILRDAEKRVELLLKCEDGAAKTVPFEQAPESSEPGKE